MPDLLDTSNLMHYRPYFTGDPVSTWDKLSPETKAQWNDYRTYKGGDPTEPVAVMTLRPFFGDLYGVDDETVVDRLEAYNSDLAVKLGLEPDVSYGDVYKALSKAINEDPRILRFDNAVKEAYETPKETAFSRNKPTGKQTERTATLGDTKLRPEEDPVAKWEGTNPVPEPPDWEKVKTTPWFQGADKDERLTALLRQRAWLQQHMMQQPGAKEEDVEDELNAWYKEQVWNALDAKIPVGYHVPLSVLKGAVTSFGGVMRGPAEIAAAAVFGGTTDDTEDTAAIAAAGATGLAEMLSGTQDKIASLIPEDPVLREALLTGKLPRGVGSAIGYAAAGRMMPVKGKWRYGTWGVDASGKKVLSMYTSRLSANTAKWAAMGVSGQATAAIEQARAMGREDKALEAAIFTAPLGALEALGFKGFGGQTAWKIVKGTAAGQMVKTVLKEGLKEGGEEGIQELLQGLGNTLYFHYSGISGGELDLDWKGLLEDGLVGFITGAGLGGANTAINRNDPVLKNVQDVLQGALAENASFLPSELREKVQNMAEDLETTPEVDAVDRAVTFREALNMDDAEARSAMLANLPSQVTLQEVTDPDMPDEPIYRVLLGSPSEVAGQTDNDALLVGEFSERPTLEQVQEMITDGMAEGLLTQADVAGITMVDAGDQLNQGTEDEAQSFNPTKVGGILPQNESLDEATGKRTTAGKVFDAVVQALRLSGSDSPLRISSKSVSGSKGTLGTYFPRDVLASVVQKNNFSVGMHEAAHAIEDAMIGKGDVWKTTTPGITPAMIQELTNIGAQLYPNAKKATKKTEGFAEFMRLWLVDPDTALKWAPEFQKWFDQYMLDPNPAFAKQLRKAQKLALTWQKQGSVARVKQHIYSPSAAEENLKQLELAASKDFLIERMVDSLRPIDEFVKEANLSRAEQGLTPLPANYDPYQVSRAESMSHHQKAQVMATQGMINLNGEIVGPSLKAGLKSVMGKYDDFTAYLYARRAIKLFAQGKKKDPGISEDDANYVYNQYHSPEFDQAARAFYAWWDGVLDYLAESSVDYKNTVDLIRKHDAGDYIPLRREFDAWDQRYKAEYSAGSSAVGAAPIHKLKGSSRRIKNPIMTSLAQVEEYLQKAHDKIVLDQIIEIAQTTPGLGRYVMPVRKDLAPAAIRSIDDLLTEINRGLKRQGADPAITDTVDTLQEAIELEGLNDVLLTFFAPRWDPKKGENPILPVFRGGKVRWYEMDHHLYGALNSNTDSKWPWYIRSTLGASARIFRMGTTGLRPRFTLITNPIRDFKTFLYNTQSSAHSPEVFLTYMRSLGREALRASFGKYTSAEAQALREFFDNHGLTMAGSMGQDIDFNARAARSLFDSGFTRLLRPRNWTDFLRDFLQFPESAARIAEVELLMKDMGIKPGDKLTREQGIILANAAKQVTTDFTAGGDTARKWNQIVPFLNAQIQGPKAHLDALQRNPFKFIRRGIESALFTAALWWSHKDDDWWTEMGAKERLGYTYIPWGKEMWRLPRAFQADGIFMAGTEALLDAAYRQDPAFITDWMFQFVATTATPSLPPIVEETIEQLVGQGGKDRFTGSPIVPRAMIDSYAADQFTPYTSTLSIKIGQIFEKAGIELSPARLDHAVSGFLGGLGRDLMLGGGWLFYGSSTGIADSDREDELSDMTLVGGLFQRGGQMARRSKSVDELYDLAEASVKLQKRLGDDEPPLAREKRLMLADAASAVSLLNVLATTHADKVDVRRELLAYRIEVAKKAIAEFKSDNPNRDEISSIRNEMRDRVKQAK